MLRRGSSEDLLEHDGNMALHRPRKPFLERRVVARSLRILRVSNNKLASLPDVLGKIVSLEVLDVSDNKLDALPAAIGNCTRLTELRASRNDLAEVPSTLGACSELRTLDLSHNKLEELPPSLCTLGSLVTLDLSSNHLSKTFVKGLNAHYPSGSSSVKRKGDKLDVGATLAYLASIQDSVQSPAVLKLQAFVRAWRNRRRFLRVIQLALAVHNQRKLLDEYKAKLLEYESACIIQRFFKRERARSTWRAVIAEAREAKAKAQAQAKEGGGTTSPSFRGSDGSLALNMTNVFESLADTHLNSPRRGGGGGGGGGGGKSGGAGTLDEEAYFESLARQLEKGMFLFAEADAHGVNVSHDPEASPELFSMGLVYNGLSMEKVVAKLTDGYQSCDTLADATLLTYRAYVTQDRMGELLIARFWEADAFQNKVVSLPTVDPAARSPALAALVEATASLGGEIVDRDVETTRTALEAVFSAHSHKHVKSLHPTLALAVKYSERDLEAELLEVLLPLWKHENASTSSYLAPVPALASHHVQLAVLLLLRRWMYSHTYDFEDRALSRRVLAFLHSLGAVSEDEEEGSDDDDSGTKAEAAGEGRDSGKESVWSWKQGMAQWVLNSLEELIFERNSSQFEFARAAIHAPPTLLPDVLVVTQIEQVEPKEMARQLTLMEHSLLRAIEAKEYMKQAWVKRGKERNAPHLLALIEFFNHVSGVIVKAVLDPPGCEGGSEDEGEASGSDADTVTRRARMIEYFVAMASEFVALNNFNGIMEVLSALHSASISRLKRTWAAVDPKVIAEFESISAIMSTTSNFGRYRTLLKGAPPPSVPYIGLFLTDLTFADDGNTDTVDETMINLEKARMVYRIVSELSGYYAGYYALAPLLSIQRFILGAPTFPDEKVAYAQSLKREPRGKGSGTPSSGKRRRDSLFRRH